MKPDFLFETSWEVCNKVGGIHTVISTKAKMFVNELKDNYILIGPDIARGTSPNREFIEDENLYKAWKIYAKSKGLNIRIGRWDIVSNPIVVLIDFSPFFNQKDAVLYELWDTYKVNSESGGWDYIEPLLFGYAAGKLIENYYEYYLSANDKIIAHFHEWMTGSGALFLKKHCPQIATTFTTHATVLGRSIAGNNLPLYDDMTKYDPEVMANKFHISAKHLMESITAQLSDGFSVVSETTNQECIHFLKKPADVITPNGFEDDFVPKNDLYKEKQQTARERIFSVTEALLNQPVNRNALLVINSGRYEFKNKGIDVFIDALGELNKSNLPKEIVAVIAIPAGHSSVNMELADRMEKKDFSFPVEGDFITHYLTDYHSDPIIQRIKKNNLRNSPEDKVKIVFIPSYLDGCDGIINLHYFDFLVGFDSSVFPSYYEPWGYTPMESLAFSIPSITTTLAGFGQWIKKDVGSQISPLTVLERNDHNNEQIIKEIGASLYKALTMSDEEYNVLRKKSFEVSRTALWKNFIKYYEELYDKALIKSSDRFPSYSHKLPISLENPVSIDWGHKPDWKKIYIRPVFPDSLKDLVRLCRNLWWSWNPEARDLFISINSEKFEQAHENPILFLASLSSIDLEHLENDAAFMLRLNTVVAKFDNYMNEAKNKPSDMVAYFSMEFGLHDSLKIYSGGLGMLAGDYLKEASDSNKNMIGIGLLYRNGYFTQQISKSGEQISAYIPQKFSHLPLYSVKDKNGDWLKISVMLPGRTVYAKVWQYDVGRIPLYLLDTDIEENSEEDRSITGQLYGGNWENRLKQEILLGMGGVRLINKMGLNPAIYHNNEGHSAFSCIERMANIIKREHLTFDEAKEVVRSSTLFTTHTPVPAGHDAFDEGLLRMYISHYADLLGLSWDDFMGLGRVNKKDHDEKFSMSILATNFSQEVNGVSAIHGKVSRQMFSNLYPGYFPEELYIGHVTNGVHFPTWAARSWRKLYESTFGIEFMNDQSNSAYWQKIYDVDDEVIFHEHLKQKEQLIREVGIRLQKEFKNRGENPNLWFETMDYLQPKALTIGFARRFATYKRAHLLFTNLEKLKQLVNNPERPLQFIFAGKAHPNDKAGQDLIKRIIRVSKMPEFIGRVIFLENYDMQLAKFLTRGVDIWLNTPTRPLEASGTSGEKAIMNGVLNFSVLDGWWAEGWKPGAGWALSEEQIYEDHELQNAMDAETIYNMLEEEIIPMYYDLNEKGFSHRWAMQIKNTIAQIAPNFTMKRQLDDYYKKFYSKLLTRSNILTLNNYKNVKELSEWKKFMQESWGNIGVLRVSYPNTENNAIELGAYYHAEIVLQLNNIPAENVGIEMVITDKENDNHKYVRTHPLELIEEKNGRAVYSLHVEASWSGVYEYAFRVYPYHHLLAHRQDFPLVKWI